jgi:catechol-2,3-dioxygenase
MTGETRLFFTIADPAKAAYDKEQTGLNHLAFAIPTLKDLQAIES